MRKDGETPLFDGQGSERTVTNSSQTVTGTLTQDGFGNTIASTGSSTNPYMFAATSGYRNDGDAGLSHVGARYYDAQVGRFISRDTYLDQHPYLYCEHDPVNAVDPSGHMPWWGRIIVNLARDGEYFGTGLTIGGLFAEGVMAIAEIRKAQREKEEWRRKHNDGSASSIANRHDDSRPSDPQWGNGKRDLPGSDRPLRQDDPEYSILH